MRFIAKHIPISRILVWILMMITFLKVNGQAIFKDGDLICKVLSVSDKTVELCAVMDELSSPDLSIPNKVVYKEELYRIVQIKSGAFEHNSSLRSLEIPDQVESIGANAFAYCRNLKFIKLPANIKELADSLFFYCSDLIDVSIPQNVTRIGTETFGHCISLESIMLPQKLETIGDEAFVEMTLLKTLNLPKSVMKIGKNTVYKCETLKGVSIEEGNQWYISIDGVVYDRDISTVIIYPPGKEEVELPEGIKYIAENTFKYSKLRSIKFPSSLQYIGSYAFYGCSSLSEINLPVDLTKIEEGTFQGCASLTSIELPEGLKEIGKKGFRGCGIQSIRIPRTVEIISESAFRECQSLKNVEIPEDSMLKTIEEDAFWNDKSLKSFYIPASVESIGRWAFTSCDDIKDLSVSKDNAYYTAEGGMLMTKDRTEVVAFPGAEGEVRIPEGTVVINKSAFESSNISSVWLPASIKELGDCCFLECYELGKVYLLAETPPKIGWLSFYSSGFNILPKLQIYVPAKSIDLYKTT